MRYYPPMKTTYYFLALTALLTSPQAFSNNVIKVVISETVSKEAEIRGYVNRLKTDSEWNVVTEDRPNIRAINEFKTGLFDCFLGGDEKFLSQYLSSPLISFHLVEIKLKYYVRSADADQFDKENVKRIATLRGHKLSAYPTLPKKFEVINFEKVTKGFELLQKKRVDAVLFWDLGADRFLPRYKGSIVSVDSDIVSTMNSGLNCHESDKNKRFLAYIKAEYPIDPKKHAASHGVRPTTPAPTL